MPTDSYAPLSHALGGAFFVPYTSSALARLTLAATIALPVIAMYGLHAVVARLDQATRAQCAANDWPVSQDAAHRQFCRTFLASN